VVMLWNGKDSIRIGLCCVVVGYEICLDPVSSLSFSEWIRVIDGGETGLGEL